MQGFADGLLALCGVAALLSRCAMSQCVVLANPCIPLPLHIQEITFTLQLCN